MALSKLKRLKKAMVLIDSALDNVSFSPNIYRVVLPKFEYAIKVIEKEMADAMLRAR